MPSEKALLPSGVLMIKSMSGDVAKKVLRATHFLYRMRKRSRGRLEIFVTLAPYGPSHVLSLFDSFQAWMYSSASAR